MLMPETKAGTPKDPPVLTAKRFEPEAILSLELIRQHTKSDDVIRVPDNLLSLYRDAALQAAESYTGMLLRQQQVVTQDVSRELDILVTRPRRPYYKVRLEYPTVDGVLYLYGGWPMLDVVTIHAEPGDTTVRVPFQHHALDMSPCCRPSHCGTPRPANFGVKLMYRAGLTDEQAIPASIRMGALKYIAWAINNPGDEALSGVNQSNVNPQAGRNNAAWQSGAVEEWRLCVRDA